MKKKTPIGDGVLVAGGEEGWGGGVGEYRLRRSRRRILGVLAIYI